MTTGMGSVDLATPRPWRLDERIGIVAIYGGDPQNCLAGPSAPFIHAAQGVWQDERWQMDPAKVADAALIVEAVNAYDRLRAQLYETGLAYHTFNGRCTTDWPSCRDSICVATRAALDPATTETKEPE